MHCQKHSPSTNPASPDATPARRYRFDILDWITALFVIAVPLLIIYRLFFG